MTHDQMQKFISTHSQICHGKPVIKGTRIMVWQILELLESGEDERSIRKAFPSLPKGAVSAALHFSAEKAKGMSFHEFKTHSYDSEQHVFA